MRNNYTRIVFFLLLIVYIYIPSFSQSSFTPNNIPGIEIWLRSDTGLTLSGNLVTQWNDISGNGNNASQGNGANKPIWSSSDTLLDNYPVVKFDGSTSKLTTNYTQPNTYSTFIIYAHRSGDRGSFYSTIQSGYPLQRNTEVFPNSNNTVYPLSDSLDLRNLYADRKSTRL